jgi:hypothetical protein
MVGWVRVHASHQQSELRFARCNQFNVVQHHSQISSTLICKQQEFVEFKELEFDISIQGLTVEAKVFGERLARHQLESSLQEVAHGVGILLQIARGKSLVSRIKQGEQFLLLELLKLFRV